MCVANRAYVWASSEDVNHGLRCGYQGNSSDGCDGGDETSDYEHFTYEDDRVRLMFTYERSILGNYSPEQFEGAFVVVSADLYPSTSSGLRYELGASLVLYAGDPGVIELAYADGRLKGRLDFGPQETLGLRVESDEASCLNGDILGVCYCVHSLAPGVSTLVEFDLPIEGGS